MLGLEIGPLAHPEGRFTRLQVGRGHWRLLSDSRTRARCDADLSGDQLGKPCPWRLRHRAPRTCRRPPCRVGAAWRRNCATGPT